VVRCHFSPYNVPGVFTQNVPGVFTENVPVVFTENVPAICGQNVPSSQGGETPVFGYPPGKSIFLEEQNVKQEKDNGYP
jgi:hypothetical protein